MENYKYQLQKYSADKVVKRLCAGTQLHLLKVVFRGAEMAVCKAEAY